MRWTKAGLVFAVADARIPWMHSHAQLPVADHVSGDVFRVYFAARTEEQVSRVGWAAVELGDRVRLLEVGSAPALEPGGIGTFDEHGVFPSCIVNDGGVKRMYYIGWNRGYRAPLFYASIGLGLSHDGGRTWHKHSPAPVMSRSAHDPCLVTSPHVLAHGGRYRMTYVSGTRWEDVGGELKSYYHIKYAESADGIEWRRDGRIAIDYAGPSETNIARSWVVPGASRLHMWFGYVRDGVPYRIGYASSTDYLAWRRDDAAAGIDVSAQGWDSEMVCYPNVVAHGGRAFMFYNGNRFGKDGFGVAASEGPLP
jgi:hypothetical protein